MTARLLPPRAKNVVVAESFQSIDIDSDYISITNGGSYDCQVCWDDSDAYTTIPSGGERELSAEIGTIRIRAVGGSSPVEILYRHN